MLDEIGSSKGMISKYYSFLSSFTHADAGYMSVSTHGYRDTIDEMFRLLSELCMEGVFMALVSDGILSKSDANKIIEARMKLATGKVYKPLKLAE